MPVGHLYIHVPFCARRCTYCDFSIAVRSSTPVDEYASALRQELEGRRVELEGSSLDTVYLGGGTPSRLGGLGISSVIASVREYASIAKSAEITIEANPDDINDLAVAHWMDAGVNRISLGAQSFDEGALKWMHRTHDAAQIGTAFLMTQESGASALHRAALANQARARRTTLTRAYTGRLARMLANRYTEEMSQPPWEILPYPLQNEITRELRYAAARAGRKDLLAFYGGQGAPLATPRPASELFAALVEETGKVFERFCGG